MTDRNPEYIDFKFLEKALLLRGSPQDFLKKLIFSFPSSDAADLWDVCHSFNYDPFLTGAPLFLQKALDAFEHVKSIDGTFSPPEEGLKGVYFCLSLSYSDYITVGGSLYFAETDWASEADFYLEEKEENFPYFDDFIDLMDERFPDKDSLLLADLRYCLFAYALVRFLPVLTPGKVLRNASIAMGYPCGRELVIGQYHNGIFTQNLLDGDDHW